MILHIYIPTQIYIIPIYYIFSLHNYTYYNCQGFKNTISYNDNKKKPCTYSKTSVLLIIHAIIELCQQLYSVLIIIILRNVHRRFLSPFRNSISYIHYILYINT